MALYTAHSLQHNTTVIPGIEGQDVQTNPEVDNSVGIGSIYPQFAVMRGQKPTILFQTHAAATILGLTGSTGVDIDDSNLLTAYFAQMDGQVPTSGSVHRSYECDRGVLVPRQLTVNHQQDAMVDCAAVLFSSDGATEPYTLSDVAALPTLARDNVRHTLGGITIAGVTFDCVTSVSIDFGNGVQTRGCGSDVWDKHVEQPGVQSVITITGLDPTKFAATGIPMVGKGGTHANTIIYLRKYDESGTDFVADITAEHIKIDAEGLASVVNHSGSGSDTSELTVQFHCTLDDSANAPIGVNAASAIT